MKYPRVVSSSFLPRSCSQHLGSLMVAESSAFSVLHSIWHGHLIPLFSVFFSMVSPFTTVLQHRHLLSYILQRKIPQTLAGIGEGLLPRGLELEERWRDLTPHCGTYLSNLFHLSPLGIQRYLGLPISVPLRTLPCRSSWLSIFNTAS